MTDNKLFGFDLFINPLASVLQGKTDLTIDVETDEGSGFVGIGIIAEEGKVLYFTQLSSELITILEEALLTGHNLKGDIKWLKSWGVNIRTEQLNYDTMLSSYVVNPVKDQQGLKPLAFEFLGMKWKTYKEMTGKGKGKKTLNMLPVGDVARYCGADCIATYKLRQYFNRIMTPNQRRILNGIILPTERLLLDIELKGVKIDTEKLEVLYEEFGSRLEALRRDIRDISMPQVEFILNNEIKVTEEWEVTAVTKIREKKCFNPGGWQQKRFVLKLLGIDEESTDKFVLMRHKDNPLVEKLLEFSALSKLQNSYIVPFKKLPSLPIIHTTYNQVNTKSEEDVFGISTGRLSSKKPNLQQISNRSEDGKKLRGLFIPREGYTLGVFDYSQVELRLIAHYSSDPILTKAFINGDDIHQATADALGVSRFMGKTGNFAIVYGASKWAVSEQCGITVDEAQNFINILWSRYSVVKAWKESVFNEAKTRGGVTTLAGRFIPVDLRSNLDFKQLEANKRFAVSAKIQGSGADIVKEAMLKCNTKGYVPVLSVHDELAFEIINTSQGLIDSQMGAVKEIMESVYKLAVPLVVEYGTGATWKEAKG